MFTAEDLADFERQHRQMAAAEAVLRKEGRTLAGRAGSFVAFLDGKLQAKAPDAETLDRELARLGVDPRQMYITYLPPEDAVFAFHA